MNRFPALSTATGPPALNSAEVAGPPSPLKPHWPSPATVLITCVVASTRRIRQLVLSAMKRFPTVSTRSEQLALDSAEVAGPPSPLKQHCPSPAIVLITCVVASTRRIRQLVPSAMKRFPTVSTASGPLALNSAEVAGPPSPLKPHCPSPAIVLITCVVASTRRIRQLLLSAMKRFPTVSTATPAGLN